MKKWFFLIAIAAAVYYQLHKPVEWQEFVSREGAFSISVPGKPREQVQKQFIGISYGSVDMHNFIVEQGDIGYVISYTDAPRSSEFARAIKGKEDDMLDGARDGALEKSRGKLVSETSIALGKYPGREIKIAGERSGVNYSAHWRVYLIGTQVYQLGVLSPKTAAVENEAARFFDSFKLIQS